MIESTLAEVRGTAEHHVEEKARNDMALPSDVVGLSSQGNDDADRSQKRRRVDRGGGIEGTEHNGTGQGREHSHPPIVSLMSPPSPSNPTPGASKRWGGRICDNLFLS